MATGAWGKLPPSSGTERLLRAVWDRGWLALLAVLGIAALAGWLTALWLPRGPVTTAQMLWVYLSSFGVGLLGGVLLRSGWAFLLAALGYGVAFELGRWGAVGPTVDLPRLDSAYGILALLLGRGFHGLVALPPLLFGVVVGLALARRWSGLSVRWTGTVWAVLLLSAIALWMALPARTPPILGADGQPLPGSVAELATVRLGGADQAILVRAHSADKPVLLYLSGGPGQSDLPFSRVILEDLSRDFVVVAWDQRGTGKSYAALEPTAAFTLERVVSDTLELANYLRQRFGEQKIYLLGESWGSTLGVLAAQRRPELFHAVIGSGQMVSQRETDRRLYRDVLALAQRTNDKPLEARMLAYGEPPYADTPYANAFVMGLYERLYKPYTPPQAYVERGSRANLGPWGVFGSEYSLVEKVNVLRGLIDMFTLMYPQIQGVDFRRDVRRLEVPVYLLDGAAELSARRDLALEWFNALQAPIKRIYTFENAAHAVAFEQFEAVRRIMLRTVLPETYPTQPGH